METQRAEFIERSKCINCNSTNLSQLSSGFFKDNPLRTFIENDPWGESPIKYVENQKWSFVKCQDCSQMFHRYILSTAWMKKCYSEWVTQEAIEKFCEGKNSFRITFEKGQQYVIHILRLKNLTSNISNQEAIRILDFGCGYGDFLATCSCFGFEGYGIDFSPARRKQGRVTILPNLEFLEQVGKEQGDFHVVTLFEVLEHLADPLGTLKSLSHFVIKGGILVLETPDCTDVTDIKTATDYRKIHPLSHINGFTPKTLSSIAQRAGFKPIPRGVAHVTDSRQKVIKTELKQLVAGLLPLKTQQYFRKI